MKKFQKCVNSFSIRSDKEPHYKWSSHLNIILVELSKFSKPMGALIDFRDFWCYLIKNGLKLQELDKLLSIGKQLGREEEVKEIVTSIKHFTEDQRLAWEQTARKVNDFFYRLDRRSYGDERQQVGREEGIQIGQEKGMQMGREEGMQMGQEKGMQMGREEGMQIGQEKGIQTTQENIAINLLSKGFDISIVVELTGLSEQNIKKLKLNL